MADTPSAPRPPRAPGDTLERRLTAEREGRLEALDALRASEALFEGAFVHAAIGMAIADPEGRWTRVNRAFCDIVGYTESELLGGSFGTITHPDDLPRDLELLGRVRAGEIDRCEIEKRLVHRDGHAVWVSLNAVAVRDDAGALLYSVLQYQDITERRRAEEALRASEERFRRVSEHAPGMVYQWVYRPDGWAGYTFVSEGARTLFGVDPEAALRDPAALTGLVHPDDYPRFHELALEVAATAGAFRWEGRVVLASGEERIIQVAADDHREPDGSVVSDGLVIDVTELRRATRQLEEREQHYRSLFHHHPDAVFSLSLDGRFTSANPACELVSGYAPHELLGSTFEPLVVPEQLELAIRHFRAAAAGTGQSYEVAIRHRSGHRVELDVTNIPMLVDGKVIGVFGIVKDLTARRALEGQLRHAQKMEAVGQLAGGVAHDFNNILSAITGFAELLEGDLDAGDPRRGDVGEILRGARRATELTKQLLAFSRKQMLQPKTIDLNPVVDETAAMLRPLLGPTVHLVTLRAPSGAPVFVDRTQLEQVLMNLVLNARDAMPDGGTITIEVSVEWRRNGASSAVLVVSDGGVGMPPEVQARIFEPFYTTKPVGQGTGLGLSTVLGIVQQSGGTIDVESREGQGTTFTVTLPLAAPAADATPARLTPAAPHAPVAPPSPRAGRGSVLLVEDEDAVRAIARRVLERAGYRVLVARHGADALRVLAEQEAPVDVLVSDVVMPEMGGVELAARAVERVPGLRVILMSGYTDADVGAIGSDGTIDAFVQKPFTAESLLGAVRDAGTDERQARFPALRARRAAGDPAR